jgi:hypothetical protein
MHVDCSVRQCTGQCLALRLCVVLHADVRGYAWMSAAVHVVVCGGARGRVWQVMWQCTACSSSARSSVRQCVAV